MTASATALYVRVSTADQRTDSQTKKLRVSCQAIGYSKVRLFVEHQSGAKVTRPHLDAMMSEVRTGKVARVVCCLPSLAAQEDDCAQEAKIRLRVAWAVQFWVLLLGLRSWCGIVFPEGNVLLGYNLVAGID